MLFRSSKHEYKFKAHTPNTAAPATFEVGAIPRTFVIDKNGQIVIDKTGAANWNSEAVRNEIDLILKD